MKRTIVLLLLLFISIHAIAQDFPFGQPTATELDMKRYDKDTVAHAVVLREYGNAFMDNDLLLSIRFIYHVKIKIFDNRGYKQGTVVLNLYKGEKAKNITGTTFYKDEKGIVQHADLDPEKIYRENIDDDRSAVKFTMPGLHDNCIIEYTYTTTSIYHYNFHQWMFQTNIPKIYSEYDTQIPAFYKYNVVLRGPLKLSKKEISVEHNCMTWGNVEAGCIKTIFAMDDIPPFVKEEYTTANSNFLSGLYFELYSTNNGNGEKKEYTDDWPTVDQRLKANERFGEQIDRKGLLKDFLPRDILAITDTLSKARAVYTFVQKQFKFNGYYDIYSYDGIKSAMDKHTGSAADINLTLLAALNAAGVNANAVILSTVDHGMVSKRHPILSDFDYVIANTVINGKSYLLDATKPLMPFGLLPMQCVNDEGRVIPSSGKPSYWINLDVPPDKHRTITSLDLTLQSDGKITGTVTRYSFGYAAYDRRVAIKKFNSVDEFVENMAESLPRIKILQSAIENLDSLDLPLTETYKIEENNQDKLNQGGNVVLSLVFGRKLHAIRLSWINANTRYSGDLSRMIKLS